ncbi:uncharacterized protein LOC135634206 [Musa acuminata AAA Group]|uniref:uncharacterized protein LOC135634206 n=1 Tax=Musa acuminata AAA Group TaxID=214697 RepID=UPI0031DC5B47
MVESPSKLHFVRVSFCLVFGGDASGCSRRAEVVLNELAMRPSDSRREGQDEACGGGGEGGREGSATPPALRAPGHLIARVFSQLDCVDLLNCALVCKQWYRDSAELREGWKNEYFEAWNLYGLCIKRETHPPSSNCSIRESPLDVHQDASLLSLSMRCCLHVNI